MNDRVVIAQAIQEVFDADLQHYLCGIDIGDKHIFSRRHNKKIRKLIKRQRKPYFKLVCTAGRRAACIIAATVIFSASAMSVNAVRKAVVDFITTVFGGSVIITSSDSSDCNGIIKQEYIITALPAQYELRARDKTKTSIVTAYHSKAHDIKLAQYTKSSYKGIYQNSNNIGKFTDIDGRDYQTVSIDTKTVYIWEDGRYIFELTSDLDRKTVLELCRSVKPQAKQSH